MASGHAALRAKLGDIFKARGVTQLHYLHCDHFEPWAPDETHEDIGPRNAELVDNFARTTARLDFARKLTLFYKVPLDSIVDPHETGLHLDRRDPVVFAARSQFRDGVASAAMRHLLSVVGHELQVHIHHELFTAHEGHPDPRVAAVLNAPEARARDGERFDLSIKLALDLIERETGVHLHGKWFFVHGKWALNASDVTVCTIVDEIEILMRNGCRGDFTFPAGRPHTNPRYEAPYFVKPLRGVKAYDYPEAEPEPAYGAKAPKDKFFIWSSKVKHEGNSLDYYSPWLRAKLEDIDAHAQHIVENSFAVDGKIFIKTHAHSMHRNYRAGLRLPIVPHAHPAIQTLLCAIFDAASEAGLGVHFNTAGEIFDLFAAAGPAAAETMEPYTPITLGRIPPPVAEYAPSVALQHADTIDAAMRAVLSRRIETLGERDSGAYSHYADLLRRGRLLRRHEEEIVRYILNHLGGVGLCHDIGAGFGSLTMLLAANGIEAAGIESDARRAATASEMIAAADAAIPGLAGRCTVVEGRFPEAAAAMLGGAGLAVTGDFMATVNAEFTQQIMQGLAAYTALLIDVDRFLIRRSTHGERLALVKDFVGLGFGEPQEAFDLGNGGKYLLFRRAAG